MPVITSEPNKIRTEDVSYGAALSEALFTKMGSTTNYILDEFIIYEFGVSGGTYGTLPMPYTFASSSEVVRSNSEITELEIFNLVSGTSGQTEFYLERQVNGTGPFATIFSTNCIIQNTAADDLYFKTLSGAAVPNVTKAVFNSVSLAANDRLRLVMVSAAATAQNLGLKLKTRPV
jgi:hypothetical protein